MFHPKALEQRYNIKISSSVDQMLMKRLSLADVGRCMQWQSETTTDVS